MTGIKTTEVLVLTENDVELKLFFERVRLVKKVVVRDGNDSFVVELKPQEVSETARSLLTRGGPDDK